MRFGLIGAGEIGRVRADALRRSRDCQLAAVADVNFERAIAESQGVPVFRDFRELIEKSDVETVIVSTPPHSHEEIALAALEAGKHVICEKPLAPSVDACQRIVQAARENERIVTTGFNQRYFPAVRFVKETVSSGAIGQLSYVRAFAGHMGLSEFRESWMHNRKIVGGGALMDNGIHIIDLVQYIMGEINEVYGAVTDKIWSLKGCEDNGFALLRSADGKVAMLQASWTEWKGYRFFIEAYGDRGMARASYAPMFSMAVYLDKPGSVRRRKFNFYPRILVREKLQGWTSTVRLAFEEEFQDFLGLAQGRKGAIADGAAGLRAVEIAHAVYASNQSRQPVKLTESPPTS